MRGRAAPFKASQARSISGRQARASPAMIGRRTTEAIAFTDSKSPSEAIGKTRLDHIHAQTVELVSQAQLFLLVHAAARRLLAIAKRGVENRDAGSLCASWISLKTRLIPLWYGRQP